MGIAKNIEAIKTTINNYNISSTIYQKIIDGMDEVEASDIEGKEFLLDKLLQEVKDLSKYVNRINVGSLTNYYPQETVEVVEKNIEKFKETMWYTERTVTGKKLYDSAIYNIESLVAKAEFSSSDYYRISDNEKTLAKKICSTLTDPKYVMEYKLSLIRISNGKMGVNEFKKLFDAIKGKIIISRTNESFLSISEYKKM